MGFTSAASNVLNISNVPSISANFMSHAGVKPEMQAASVQGALKQGQAGLEQQKDVRTALGAALDSAKDNAGGNLNPAEASKGPSVIGQIAQGVGIAAVATVAPALAAGLALTSAVIGGAQMLSSKSAEPSAEYKPSSFKSYTKNGKEEDKPSVYMDAMGEAWDWSGYKAPAQPQQQPMGIQANMMEAARDTVAKLGVKEVEKQLSAASSDEKRFAGQIGATRAFAEKGFAQGPTPPAMAGMGPMV